MNHKLWLVLNGGRPGRSFLPARQLRCVAECVRIIEVLEDELLQLARVRREHKLIIVRVAGLVRHQDVTQRLRLFLQELGEPLKIQNFDLQLGPGVLDLEQVMQGQMILHAIRPAEVQKNVVLEAESMRFVAIRLAIFDRRQPVSLLVEPIELPVVIRGVGRARFRPAANQRRIELNILGGVKGVDRGDNAAGQQGRQRQSGHDFDRRFHRVLVWLPFRASLGPS